MSISRRSLLRSAAFGLVLPFMPLADRVKAAERERMAQAQAQEHMNAIYRRLLDNAAFARPVTGSHYLVKCHEDVKVGDLLAMGLVEVGRIGDTRVFDL